MPTKPRRRAPAPAPASPSAAASALTALQRWALELGEAEAFSIAVEAADGTRVELRKGKSGRLVVITLGGDGPPAEDARGDGRQVGA